MTSRYSVLERGTYAAISAAYSAVSAMPPKRDWYPQFPATVTEVSDLSAAFRRVTLTAPELTDLQLMGPDEYVGLFMPRPGMELQLPPNVLNPRSSLAKLPEDVRPDLRWYTIRHHRPQAAHCDIDIVHGVHDGPGARWIASVQPGAAVGIRFQTALYAGAPPAGRQLLLADETGLPGLLAILDAVGARAQAGHQHPQLQAVVELPDDDFHVPDLADRDVVVVHRHQDAPGSALLAELRNRSVGHLDYAWVCAEAATIAAAKRHLVKQLRMPRRSIMATGLWKVGHERR